MTVVFAILDRTGADTGRRWDVDQLPEPRANCDGRSDLMASLGFLAASAGALLWDRLQGFVRPGAEPLPILNPELWPWSISGLFILIAAKAVLAIVIYRAGNWTTRLATANTALAVLFVSLTITLLTRSELLNPEFTSFAFTHHGVDSDVLRILAIITGVTIVGTAGWDSANGWRKAARATRP